MTVSEREQRILGIIETARSKRAKFRDERITMSHGAGGKATTSLIEGLLAPALRSAALDELGDAGFVTLDGTGLALTTDSFVVKPLRFPGGSIGELAVGLSASNRSAEIELVGGEQTGTELTVGGEPYPVAVTAERLGDTGNHPDRAAAVAARIPPDGR